MLCWSVVSDEIELKMTTLETNIVGVAVYRADPRHRLGLRRPRDHARRGPKKNNFRKGVHIARLGLSGVYLENFI